MSLVRIVRPMIHFGPWRVIPIYLIRRLRPAHESQEDGGMSLLGKLDTAGIIDEIRRNSMAIAGVLPLQFVERVRLVTDRLPVDEYKQMYHVDKDIRRLADDPAIRQVLRAYFKSEPVLLESTIAITKQASTNVLSGQNLFHIDYAGWQSLNVFVYLTDVTMESSYHIVAKGSHRKIRLRDAFIRTLSIDKAERRFGTAIQPITGQAGTVFFENTEAFHRRHSGKGQRVILNLLFASHRSWFSHGRASRSDVQKSVEVYEQIRKTVPCLNRVRPKPA